MQDAPRLPQRASCHSGEPWTKSRAFNLLAFLLGYLLAQRRFRRSILSLRQRLQLLGLEVGQQFDFVGIRLFDEVFQIPELRLINGLWLPLPLPP